MAALLSSADWPEVRAAIDVRLNTTSLPDATIALDAFSGAAEREVLEHDPEASSYVTSTTEYKRARLAAVYFCAARLIPSIPRVVSQQLRDLNVRVDEVSMADRIARLRDMAFEEIAKNNEADGSASEARIPTMFTSVTGRSREWLL